MFLKLEQIFTWNFIIYEGSQVSSICKVFPILITFWHNYAIFLTSLLLFVLVHLENERLFVTVSSMIWQYVFILLPVQLFSPEIISFYIYVFVPHKMTKVISLTTSRLLSRTFVGVRIAFSDSSSFKCYPYTIVIIYALFLSFNQGISKTLIKWRSINIL
jgi:hypothetical protein